MSEPIQPKGIPIKIGPFKVEWESNLEQEKVDIIAKLGDPSRIFTLGALQQLCADDWGGLADLSNWAEWKYRIKGQTHFAVTELALAADRILQARVHIFRTSRPAELSP